MRKSLFLEADCDSASQEISPQFVELWDLLQIYKGQSVGSVLNQMNLFHSHAPLFFKDPF